MPVLHDRAVRVLAQACTGLSNLSRGACLLLLLLFVVLWEGGVMCPACDCRASKVAVMLFSTVAVLLLSTVAVMLFCL